MCMLLVRHSFFLPRQLYLLPMAQAYELALQVARKEMSWTDDSVKALVMIGDDVPHPVCVFLCACLCVRMYVIMCR